MLSSGEQGFTRRRQGQADRATSRAVAEIPGRFVRAKANSQLRVYDHPFPVIEHDGEAIYDPKADNAFIAKSDDRNGYRLKIT